MNTISRDSIHIHYELPPQALPDDRVAIDTELFNMQKSKLHRPHGQFASLACTYDGVNVYMIFDEKQVPAFFEMIEPAVHIYQNAMFDIRQLRRYAEIPDRKRLWDTMLIEKVMYNGYYSDFSLSDLARRYLGIYLPKEERKSFGTDSEMDEEKIFYAACDVIATWKIYQEQRQAVSDTDLRLWTKVELPNLWATIRFQGALVDQEKWSTIADGKEKLAKSIWDELDTELGINIKSNQQLHKYLLSEGIKVENVQATTLEEYRGEHPVVDRVLNFRKPQKGASTYGKKWLLDNVEADGRVYSAFNPLGAITGRYSSSGPNMQNIPVRDEPIYRECFIAAPGRKLIIADWAAQEPRIAAYMSGDRELWDIFSSDSDPYIQLGKLILKVDFGKKDPRRKSMKDTFLGLCYGMTGFGLSAKLECSQDEAEDLIDSFFDRFPSIKEYAKEKVDSAYKRGYVETIMGRKVWINTYQGRINQVAPNYPIQGSAGDEIKLSNIGIYQYWYPLYNYHAVVLPVHDELVLEVDEDQVDEAYKLLEDTMVNVAETMHPGVPSKAELHVGNNWNEKAG